MSNDVRVSNPNGTSIYESLSLKADNTDKPQQTQQVKQETAIPTNDQNKVVEPPKGKEVNSVELFNDNKQAASPPNAEPLKNVETGEVLNFLVDQAGSPVRFQTDDAGNYVVDGEGNPIPSETGAPIPVDVNNPDIQAAIQSGEIRVAPLYAQVNGDGQAVDAKGQPTSDLSQFVYVKPTNTGDVPAAAVNFSDNNDNSLPPLLELNKNENTNPTNETQATGEKPATQAAGALPLVNVETGEVLLFKVDDKGAPMMDENGEFILDAENGKPVFIQVDGDGNPITNEDGSFVIADQQGQPLPNIEKFMKSPAMKRINMIFNRQLADMAVRGASNLFIKGVSIGVPMTTKAIGFGATHAVRKAVQQQAMSMAAKTAKLAGNATIKETMEKGVEVLTKSAANVASKTTSRTMGQVAKAANGSLFSLNPMKMFRGYKAVAQETKLGVQGAKAFMQASKGKPVVEVAKQVASGAFKSSADDAVKLGISTAAKVGTEKAMKSIPKSVLGKVATSAGQKGGILYSSKGTKMIVDVAAKTAAKQTTTRGARIGAKIAGVAPYVGGAIGVGITAMSAKDAYTKWSDGSGTLSAGLATGTAVLDAVATGAMFAGGRGKAISWAATGLGIATSVASDLTRNKPAEEQK